jgi:endonuclease III
MARGGDKSLTLKSAAAALARLYPAEDALTDPFELVVWENIGYLADDDKRRDAFEELRRRVGLKPKDILKAPAGLLRAIARKGGIHADLRAERLREAARLAMESCGGNVLAALRALPPAKARSLVKTFPAIGDPGADRILLAAGIALEPALDSNGLRVITRLGFCVEEKSYSSTYRSARKAIVADGKADRTWLMRLDKSARAHGKALCRRNDPQCLACPLEPGCAYARQRKASR